MSPFTIPQECPALCPLCHRRNETFNHLFFLCQYSATVLHDTLRLPTDWAGLKNSIIQFQGRKLSKNIPSLSLAATFYKIWEARNMKIHKDKLIPPSQLAIEVVNIIKSRLSQSNTFVKTTNYCQFYCNRLL